MAENNLSQLLESMADAIREKDGTTQKISPQDFAERIREISGGRAKKESFTLNSGDVVTLFSDAGVYVLDKIALAYGPIIDDSVRVTIKCGETIVDQNISWDDLAYGFIRGVFVLMPYEHSTYFKLRKDDYSAETYPLTSNPITISWQSDSSHILHIEGYSFPLKDK